jgi:hypothetical protein
VLFRSPDLAQIEGLIAAGGWAPPAVEAPLGSDPWGWALSGQLSDAAHYVWSDTFDAVSQSNVHRTYVLFRTVAPLLGPPGRTELPAAPITTYFRREFTLPADPDRLAVWLAARADDGAVLYVNGEEVLRLGMPEGPVGPNTFAAEARQIPASASGVPVPESLLVPGVNVLAAEVHQAAPGGGQMVFGAELFAQVWPATGAPSGARLNEVSGGGPGFWVELGNAGEEPVDTGGMVLRTSVGAEAALPPGTLAGGDVSLVTPDLAVLPGDALFLYAPGKSAVFDGVRVGTDPRARQGADWLVPAAPTPGAPNPAFVPPAVVINEVDRKSVV